MSLARRVIEKRRMKESRSKDAPRTKGPRGGVSSFGNLKSSTPLPTNKNQTWGTHGHRTSEKATEVQRSHMAESREHRRRRPVIHGGTHGNSYEPPEVRGER